MIKENDKEIQKLENKINIFKRILIVGLILIIISFCCMGLLMLRINQLQNELNELDRESDELTVEEHRQRLDEIDLEIDTFWIYNIIFMFISLCGITLMSIGNRYRRFKVMREEYLIQLEDEIKLSFKVDSKD